LDSITVATPSVVNDPYAIIASDRPTWQYGANLSGGAQTLRYFLSGNYDSQVGVLQIPPAVQDILKTKLGVTSLSDQVRNPNTLKVITTHGTVSTDVGDKGNVALTTSYTQTDHHTLHVGFLFNSALNLGAPNPYADTTDINNYFASPGYSLENTDDLGKHSTAGLSGTVRPLSWLSVNGTVGIDLYGTTTHTILPSGEVTPDDPGYAEDARRDNVARTATLGTQALAHPGPWSFRSSLGVQYTYTNLDGVTIRGDGLAPGSTSIGTIQNKEVFQLWGETVSLGTYGEEVIGFNDRLFLSGALRLDGSTSFGDDYHPHPYPKVGLSWIVTDEPFVNNLSGLKTIFPQIRLRAAYGSASRYPTSEMRLGSQRGNSYSIEGGSQLIFTRDELSNPLLRPERTRETEYGADITAFSNILINLSWNRRRTIDQLQGLSYTGLPSVWVNVGDLEGHGFEATATIPVFERRSARADLALAYSYHTDKVLSLGALPDYKDWSGTGYAVGYPMGSTFGYRILGVSDTVGGRADSIILRNEITMDTAVTFFGVVTPPRTYTATPTVSLFNGFVRLSALFDRETGFVRYDDISAQCIYNALCTAPFLKTTSPMIQAKYIIGGSETWFAPGDFTRWRELNLAVQVPQRFLRIDPIHLRFTGATVSLQGRNLMLWTKYTGPDPESRNSDNIFGRVESSGIPQARAWSFRFDITP